MANIQKNIAKEKHAAYRETYSRLKPEYQETVFNPSGNLADEPATAPVAFGAAAPAPAGVDPSVWEDMSPEGRALWK